MILTTKSSVVNIVESLKKINDKTKFFTSFMNSFSSTNKALSIVVLIVSFFL